MIKLRISISFFLFCILQKCEILDAAATNRDNCKECQTSECKDAASTILQNIDPKVAPCDDFYKFACGNFIKTEVIPEEDLKVDRYSSLNLEIKEQQKRDLEQPIQPDEPRFVTLSKNFYSACMNTTAIEENGLKTVLSKLKEAGGWPLLEGDSWNEESFDWKNATCVMRDLGFQTYLFTLNVTSSDVSDGPKNMLTINAPVQSLKQGLKDDKVDAYYNYAIDIAVLYGAERARAAKELQEVIDFQIQLGSMCPSFQDFMLDDSPKKRVTVRDLAKEYPGIPWKEYFNIMLKPTFVIVGNDQVVEMNFPDLFKKLEVLIQKTPKRVLANYLMWQAVEETADYVTEKVMKRLKEYEDVEYGHSPLDKTVRWQDCLENTHLYLKQSMDALYVMEHFNQKSRENVEELAVSIEEQLKKLLGKVEWMDEKTRTSALEKLQSMKNIIGSIDEIFDVKSINDYYKDLGISSNDHVQAYLNISKFIGEHSFNKLSQPVGSFDAKWLLHPRSSDTSASIDYGKNSISVPAGILRDVFFNESRPQYLNYAGIGPFLIGNRITTPFDKTGSRFDKDGVQNVWWTPETEKKFDQEAACLIQQYGNFTVQDGGIKMNSSTTKDKIVADNGGVKISYLAYQDWVKSHGPEPTLPGLKYTQSQLFWIQAAITQCAKYTPEYLKETRTDDPFFNDMNAPSEFSVRGVFANRPEFAIDFNCPAGSKMNPVKKCSVW